MRIVFAFCLILISASRLSAQEQERKLLDRLLKPDMALQNDAQSKRFVAGGATLTKKAQTKPFYVAERKKEKGFWNTRQVSPKEFSGGSSQFAARQADLRTRSKIAKIDVAYSTPAYNGVRTAADADKSEEVSEFDDGKRVFTGRGKSQKSLSAQHPPLTIEQVRELLNKNK